MGSPTDISLMEIEEGMTRMPISLATGSTSGDRGRGELKEDGKDMGTSTGPCESSLSDSSFQPESVAEREDDGEEVRYSNLSGLGKCNVEDE